MENTDYEPVSVFRFVLAFLAVKLLAGGGAALYAVATGHEPSISSIPITIAALGIAMLWYIKSINRPMTGSEIFKFSIGNTLADIVLSLAWLTGMIWLLGVPFSWEGVNAVFGTNGDPKAVKVLVATSFMMGVLQVFLLSAFFAWLMSKNLPKANS